MKIRRKLINYIVVNVAYVMIVFYINGTLYPPVQSERVFTVFMWVIFNGLTLFGNLKYDDF